MPRWAILSCLAGPAGYKQCAVVASDRALDEPGLESCDRRRAMEQKISLREFSVPLWLDRQDSNLRMTGPKPVALPLGDGPIFKYLSTSGAFCRY